MSEVPLSTQNWVADMEGTRAEQAVPSMDVDIWGETRSVDIWSEGGRYGEYKSKAGKSSMGIWCLSLSHKASRHRPAATLY